MLFVMLAILVSAGDPCAHVPTPLTRNQSRVCKRVAARAATRGIDPALAVAVAYHETKFLPRIGAAGEIGPLQAMPKYWCPKRGKCDAVDAGLKALAYYTNKHKRLRDALTRYNGAGASARAYAQEVQKIHQQVLDGSRLVLTFPSI